MMGIRFHNDITKDFPTLPGFSIFGNDLGFAFALL
jgi:hypothetical protein